MRFELKQMADNILESPPFPPFEVTFKIETEADYKQFLRGDILLRSTEIHNAVCEAKEREINTNLRIRGVI